jgi:hypothetical protein
MTNTIPSPRPHRMMPVKPPQILQRIAADNATRALRKTAISGLQAANGLYAPNPAPFYVNVYQLSPGRHFLGAPSAGPIYSNHAVYRLRVTPKAGVSIRDVVGGK